MLNPLENNQWPLNITHQTDEMLEALYQEWDRPARQTQISAICLLTALLYITFALIEKSWASPAAQDFISTAYLWVIAPVLLAISALAYTGRYPKLMMTILAVHPVIAATCHAFTISLTTDATPLLVEGYLIVFWTFIVSGIRFRYAIPSAATSSLILLISGAHVISDRALFELHAFWILCSFSFGLLGAYLLHRSLKALFLSQQQLQIQAMTDPLTGSFNRYHLSTTLANEIDRSSRYLETFGILMLDIDHFKDVNDSLGHEVGDQILKEVASVIDDSIRTNDTLVRWGGEEFVVVALKMDDQKLRQFGDKLRSTIEQHQFNFEIKLTISIGGTLYNEGDSVSSLMERADQALYKAKDNGRNLVCLSL